MTIERLAAGGDGVGRLEDGVVVFVPRTAPGELVEIDVVERKARYARGRLTRVVQPGSDRVGAACVHYVEDRCGGCQLQHLSPEAQRAVKGSLVGDALRRIGRREVADPVVVPSPGAWRYRSKLTLAVRHGRIGLHPYDRPETTFALSDCLITRDRLMGLWSRVREHSALLPAGLDSLVLKEDRSRGLHLIAEGGEVPWDADPLARAVGDEHVSFWWRPALGAARVVSGPATGYPALAFEQINPAFAARIRAEAVEALGEVGERVVWDLYGGVGDTAELLAARGARVYSVDADRSAIEWARNRLASSSTIRDRPPSSGADEGWAGRVTCLAGLVEEVLHRLPEPDALMVNPPRAGLHRRVAAHLERWAARGPGAGARVCYVSCDPATLARDLSRLPSLALRDTRAYDLFPQTSHVETLAVLEPA